MAPKRNRNEESSSTGPSTDSTPTGDGRSSDTTYVRPRTRQRIPKNPAPLTVPNIEEDAAERKRVLNVLAQRRRESKTRGATSKQSHSDPSLNKDGRRTDNSEAVEEQPNSGPAASMSAPHDVDPLSVEEPILLDNSSFLNLDLPSELPLGMFEFDDGDTLTSLPTQTKELPGLNVDDQPPTLGFGLSTSASARANAPPTVDPNVLLNVYSSSTSDASSDSASASMSADSYLLPVNELTILRAALRIAARLGCSNTFWDLSADSPFCPTLSIEESAGAGLAPSSSSIPPPPAPSPAGMDGTGSHLPKAWQPTTSQLLLPHHPIMDFLPWPSVRDRIISVFNLPETARPRPASGPLALVEFAYDLEDGAEGIRIWGGDPYDPSCWEVGQVVFEKWWFIFDRQVVEQSNRWRAARGAEALKVKGNQSWEIGSVAAG